MFSSTCFYFIYIYQRTSPTWTGSILENGFNFLLESKIQLLKKVLVFIITKFSTNLPENSNRQIENFLQIRG